MSGVCKTSVVGVESLIQFRFEEAERRTLSETGPELCSFLSGRGGIVAL